MRRDVYQEITDKIVAQLERGVSPVQCPWAGGEFCVPLPRRHNGVPYRGVNVLMLWITAFEQGYRAPIWMTFKQAIDLGGGVRKGEKGTRTVYADSITKTQTDAATGAETESEIHFMKGYTVFNVAQIDGLPPHYYPAPLAQPMGDARPRIGRAEAFFAATGAVVRHFGNRACYKVADDFIQMPEFQSFRDAESYYAVLGHETVHWTGHPSRLARLSGTSGDEEDYAKEELVAELGSAFLCASLDLSPEPRPDHAAYLDSWLKALKDDKRLIFTAAAAAQRAVDFLHGLQPQTTEQAA